MSGSRSQVKIGTDLYQTILPMVQQQVSSQIKVRDLSAAKMTISPADATSWQEARTELLSEAKTALRSELETALSAAGSDSDIDSIKGKFTKKELTLEHDIDSKVHTFSATIDVTCARFDWSNRTQTPKHPNTYPKTPKHTQKHTHRNDGVVRNIIP